MVFTLHLTHTSIKNFLRKERVNRTIEGITGAVLLVFGVRLFSKNKYVDKTRNKKVDYFSFYSLKSATESDFLKV